MKCEINVFYGELLAAKQFSSTDESRFVLTSVSIECTPRGILLVATNGRGLSVIKTAAPNDLVQFNPPAPLEEPAAKPAVGFMQFLIPATHILQFPGSLIDNKLKTVVAISYDCASGIIEMSYSHGDFKFCVESIKGVYPNWRNVLPTGVNDPVKHSTSVACTTMMAAMRLAEMMGNLNEAADSVLIQCGGKNDVIRLTNDATCDSRFFCIVMPQREERSIVIGFPDWI